MLRKIWIGSVSVILLLTMLGVACAPAPPQESKPADIQLRSVLPLFAGTESITFLPVFSISNPNNFFFGIDSLEYILSADGEVIGTSQLRNIYIPPEGEVETKDAIAIVFNDLIGAGMMGKGLSQAEAVGAALAMWKTLGGALPMSALQPVWDTLPEKKAMFEVKGTALPTDESGKQPILLQLKWQAT